MFSGVQAGTNIEFIGGISNGFLRTAQYFELVKDNQKELEYADNSGAKNSKYYNLQEELEDIPSPLMDKSNSREQMERGCV
jgi:CRISPR/Cas system CSM-associated protein Csm5 (group 7 of RAMP superfamily)